jgi:putative ABC transport system ATP-binding protein
LVYCPAIMIVDVAGLTHVYRERDGRELPVLRGVDLEVTAAEHVALVGPSGSGKTTLLSLLGGLEAPQAGRVVVAGHDLQRLRGNGLAEFRQREVGFVFQHFGLLAALSALENVELALSLAGLRPRRRRRRATEVLERVGLGGRLDHLPRQLSGGERQRVAIARAISNAPRLVLADEPTGNLDDESARSVGDLLESIRRSDGTTLVVVTHNHQLARRADRRLFLRDGRLEPGDVGALVAPDGLFGTSATTPGGAPGR